MENQLLERYDSLISNVKIHIRELILSKHLNLKFQDEIKQKETEIKDLRTNNQELIAKYHQLEKSSQTMREHINQNASSFGDQSALRNELVTLKCEVLLNCICHKHLNNLKLKLRTVISRMKGLEKELRFQKNENERLKRMVKEL